MCEFVTGVGDSGHETIAAEEDARSFIAGVNLLQTETR
jgi:hypothetical protein